MRRVVCSTFGPLDGLAVATEADPTPGAGEVLVAVRAAGVNFVDALLATGRYQIKPPLPFTPGSEIAGDVLSVGDGVAAPRVGDRVAVSCGVGGFADRLVAPASVVRPLPDRLSYGQGAVLVQSYATMLFAFTRRAPLERGQWVLVLGAGGGIGLAAVDLARHFGARVVAAASTAEKLGLARSHGAEVAVAYEQEDLKARVRELTGGGVDVVVDPVGGAHAVPALRTLRPFGRYLVLGFAGGAIPQLPANFVLLQNRAVVGVDWGAWAYTHHAENAALLDELFALAAAGAVTPPEPTSYPLERAGAALADLQARRIAGKLVLTP